MVGMGLGWCLVGWFGSNSFKLVVWAGLGLSGDCGLVSGWVVLGFGSVVGWVGLWSGAGFVVWILFAAFSNF